ncbi:hypothetical protein BDV12DRAFT_87738 [Aspergillus spectabilis]
MDEKKSPSLDLPGFNLPLDFRPTRDWNQPVFGNGLDGQDREDGYVGYLYTIKELAMMQIMETITDKPNWQEKIFNDAITAKWREEIQDEETVTEAMMDYMLDELQWKTTAFKNTGILRSYDPGVVKSDTAIERDLQKQLQDLVKPLEEEPKDYHPGSGNKVVDLVHPSLFPLVYGQSRILTDKLTTTDNCFLSIGQGELTKVPEAPPVNYRHQHNHYSNQFQWLPCDVKFNNNGECQIASYINNLHPAKHRNLYHVLEKILTRTIPLWNETLHGGGYRFQHRIEYTHIEWLPTEEPEPKQESEDDEDEFWERHEAWREKRLPKHPDPPIFEPPVETARSIHEVNLQKDFAEKGLQVIVKLANIELTPEQPHYDGGSWHIEGQLNERICATAIYYYDSQNITDNTLSFRHRSDERHFDDVEYEQGEFEFLDVFGFDADAGRYDSEQITQSLGSVTCREGRLLTFPNTLQHRVSPFSLTDPSKPGHRKILAFFLIDPMRRIISSANVPPQREDWCEEWRGAMRETIGKRLPVELQCMVQDDKGFEPMTMDRAKELRLKLMEERGANASDANEAFEHGTFNLCEH